jgi:hypothetical protein
LRSILSLVAAVAVLGCPSPSGHSSHDGGPAPGAPTITSLSPSSGAPGTSVTIAGTNLGNATAVTFNGVSAPIASKSDTSLTVTVPDGATSGPVSVATPTGTATTAAGAGFTVNSGSGSSTAMWLEFTGKANYQQPSIAVDANGGIHTAYADFDQGPVRYAYCRSSCENEASWTRIDVSSAGEHLGGSYPFPTLALDPQGRPRVMFVHGHIMAGAFTYEYAACDADCTNSASWKVTPLLDVDDLHWPAQSGYFAIDSQGSAAFALHSYSTSYSAPTQLRYARCDASCTEAASWKTVDLVEAWPVALSLAFAGPGQPRVAFSRQAGYLSDGTRGHAMSYAQCDSDCLTESSWQYLDLAQVGSDAKLSLGVESGGKVRVAAAMGHAGMYTGRLAILACDTGCASDLASWKVSTPGFAFVPSSVALALDGAGGMSLGIGTDDDLRIYTCASDCAGSNVTWQGRFIETTLDLDKTEPIPLKPACTTQGWRHFRDVGMALDPQGKIRLVAGVEHLQGGFLGDCKVNADCPGGDVCVQGKCSKQDCAVYPDVALDRLYLLP